MSDWFKSKETRERVSPEEIIRAAIAEHNPVRIYACFSSGNDSQVSTHIAMQNGATEVFNADTTIGIPEAREHLKKVCERFGWPLNVKKPPNMNYREMCLRLGFPGPGVHNYPYAWLKAHAIDELVREAKREWSDRVMLITGARERESDRRMGHVEPIVREGAKVWVAPIFDWSNAEKDDYIEKHDLERSPVTEKLGISGECLCGAFARAGERRKIAQFYPEFEQQLIQLETDVKAVRQPYCEWGNARRVDPDQKEIFMPFCVDCH